MREQEREFTGGDLRTTATSESPSAHSPPSRRAQMTTPASIIELTKSSESSEEELVAIHAPAKPAGILTCDFCNARRIRSAFSSVASLNKHIVAAHNQWPMSLSPAPGMEIKPFILPPLPRPQESTASGHFLNNPAFEKELVEWLFKHGFAEKVVAEINAAAKKIAEDDDAAVDRMIDAAMEQETSDTPAIAHEGEGLSDEDMDDVSSTDSPFDPHEKIADVQAWERAARKPGSGKVRVFRSARPPRARGLAVTERCPPTSAGWEPPTHTVATEAVEDTDLTAVMMEGSRAAAEEQKEDVERDKFMEEWRGLQQKREELAAKLPIPEEAPLVEYLVKRIDETERKRVAAQREAEEREERKERRREAQHETAAAEAYEHTEPTVLTEIPIDCFAASIPPTIYGTTAATTAFNVHTFQLYSARALVAANAEEGWATLCYIHSKRQRQGHATFLLESLTDRFVGSRFASSYCHHPGLKNTIKRLGIPEYNIACNVKGELPK